jgi:hypothetical protein
MKTTLAACIILVLLSGFATLSIGQSPAPAPAFEAVDVHPSAATVTRFSDAGFLPNGRVQLRGATMVDLIRTAWNIDGESVFGGPNWLDSDRFDVNAKAAASASKEDRALMLRALLADRFKLVVHNDEKTLNVFALTVGKRGSQVSEGAGGHEGACRGDFDQQLGLKLEPAKRPTPVIAVDSVNRNPTANAPDIAKSLPPETPEFEAAEIKLNKSGGNMRRIQPKPGGRIEVENIPLKQLVSLAWDFDLDRIVGAPKWFDSDAYDVVAKQLGLHLDKGQKHPMTVLVVDHAERLEPDK